MKAGHVVNSFDPASDVVRCVRELNLHSRHEHCLYVKTRHPDQHVFRFGEPDPPTYDMTGEAVSEMMAGTDVIIYHFTGWEGGWHDLSKPSAFRNCNIYYNRDEDRFWSYAEYNAASYDRYRLVASSHAGAADFLPADRFRWLPDLLPLDGPYSFDPAPRPPAVSYIKHAAQLRERDFGGAAHIDCFKTPHADVLARRRSQATAVIDNVEDGHYGLAGQEAAGFGLPVVVYNHPKTLQALAGWEKPGTMFPFIQAESVDEARDLAADLASRTTAAGRRAIRAWAEEFLDPRRLISEYWDPFITELGAM